MKVQTNKTPVGFTSITTSITFETQEELDTFNTALLYNETVPLAIGKEDPSFNANLMQNMMISIAEGMWGSN